MNLTKWYTGFSLGPWYLRRLGIVTWLDIILFFSLLLGNSLALSIRIHNVRELAKRAGLVSTINLIPLLLGSQVNVVVRRCSISLRLCSALRQWLGMIIIGESLVHVIATCSLQRPNFHRQPNAAGLAGMITFLAIVASQFLRRRFYELYHSLQIMFSSVVVAALCLHNSTYFLHSPTIYLTIAVGIQIVIVLLRSGLTLYRTAGYKQPLSRASIRTIFFKQPNLQTGIPLDDAVHVHIRLSRPWKYRAGQYIYLNMPGVSRTSFAQSHPYYIAWSYCKDGSDYIVLITEKRRGFTKQLCSHRSDEPDDPPKLLALVEGPYGKELGLSSYGTVVLFATGIGIAGQLSFVSQLLNQHGTHKSQTRRIVLYWQVEKEAHTAWVADRMQVLLKQDKENGSMILDFHLYVLSDFLSPSTKKKDFVQKGERLDLTYDAMNVDQIIKSESKQRKGRLAIAVCADRETESSIRKSVSSMKGEVISIKELDFQPDKVSDTPSIYASV